MKTITMPKHIVVIGGGFAGLNFIKGLANNAHYTITLVDTNNYNQFTPLVYQVATGFLEPSSIVYPFRKFLQQRKNVRFHAGSLEKVLVDEHQVQLNNALLTYDYLVLATGSISNFYGNAALKHHTIHMKTVKDALNMRNALLESLEQACRTTDEHMRAALLTIVVAGGGPTGVEVAGMLGEMQQQIIQKDYPELKQSMGAIYLVDGARSLLAQMDSRSQQGAMAALEKLQVKIILNTYITTYHDHAVQLSNGQTIRTHNLIWAAGVTGNVLEGIPAHCYGRNNRLIVDSLQQVTGAQDVYAIGDNALQTADARYPNGHPQLAQPAIQQGRLLARNFKAMTTGKALQSFQYLDKGVMAIIGKNRAVVDITRPPLHIQGWAGLLIWLFIHVRSLVSYDNKLKTFFNWIISYLTGDQSMRVVIRTREDA